MSTEHRSNNRKTIPLWRFMYPGRPAAEERAYREHFLNDDIRQISTIGYAGSAMMLALTLIDIPNMNSDPQFVMDSAVRLLIMLAIIGLVYMLHRYRRPTIVDAVGVTMTLSLALAAVAVHWTSESSGIRILGITTLLIMVAHVASPVYATLLLPSVMVLIVGEGLIVFSPSRSDLVPHRPVMIVVVVFAEYVSVMASAYHNRARYHVFQAMRQIKTLSGMLPICSGCKNIRNDKGYYQQIEHYISEHSDAEFTHGMCPVCIKEFYPELEN